VKLATDALDDVRRQVWQCARKLPDKQIAKTYKGARWALLKNPESLTDTQKSTLAQLKREGGALVRAYELKESLRAVFAGDLDTGTVTGMLGKWCSWAQRCRIPQFVKVGKTIRKHLDGRLTDIQTAIAKVYKYRSSLNGPHAEMAISAILREIGIIGEAVNAPPEHITAKRPEIA
jgi:transposase